MLLGEKIKIAVEYLSLRDLVAQFSEVTGEKAGLALELTREQFEASRYADHPAAEFMYFSWEYVIRAGPDSGVRVRLVNSTDELLRILTFAIIGCETNLSHTSPGKDIPAMVKG